MRACKSVPMRAFVCMCVCVCFQNIFMCLLCSVCISHHLTYIFLLGSSVVHVVTAVVRLCSCFFFCSWPIFSYCVLLFGSFEVYEFVCTCAISVFVCVRRLLPFVYLDRPLAHTWTTTNTATAVVASFTLLYKIKIDYFFCSLTLLLSTCCNVFTFWQLLCLEYITEFVLFFFQFFCFFFRFCSLIRSFIGSLQLASLAYTSSSSTLSFSFTFLLSVLYTNRCLYMCTVSPYGWFCC